MTSLYFSPEDCGLEVVGHLEEPDMSYEFHILGVWKDPKSGKLFWSEDSGCSCPIAFEDEHFNDADDTSLSSDLMALGTAILDFPCSTEEKEMLIGWIKEKKKPTHTIFVTKSKEPFNATTMLSAEQVENLLCCGMESGSYGDFTIVGYEPEGIAKACTYPHNEVPFMGGAVLMKDKYGDSEKVYKLDREALQRGLTILGEKYPHHMANIIDENEDVITGVSFIQCALLGEIVYG